MPTWSKSCSCPAASQRSNLVSRVGAFWRAAHRRAPTYFGARAWRAVVRSSLITIPTTSRVLAGLLQRRWPRPAPAWSICSRLSNPTVSRCRASGAEKVLDLVSSANAFLIEDDYARDSGAGRAPPRPLYRESNESRDLCALVTKSPSPGLRVGAYVASGPCSP